MLTILIIISIKTINKTIKKIFIIYLNINKNRYFRNIKFNKINY